MQRDHSQQLVVASRDALEQLPFAVYTGQQVGNVGLRATPGLEFRLSPIDHLVCNEGRYVAVEALRQRLTLGYGEVGQLQALSELLGVEQPDQDVHQYQVLEIQFRIAVPLYVIQVLGQQLITLKQLALLATVDRADPLQIARQRVLHKLQMLSCIGRTGQRGVSRISHLCTGGGSRWVFGDQAAFVRQCQAHAFTNSTFSVMANFSSCSIT